MPTRCLMGAVVSLLVVMVVSGCPGKAKPAEEGTLPRDAGTAAENAPPEGNAEANVEANEEANAEAEVETSAAVEDAKALAETKCAKCHSFAKATEEPGDQAHWDALVKEMQAKEAGWISDEEATLIAAYMAEAYPKL